MREVGGGGGALLFFYTNHVSVQVEVCLQTTNMVFRSLSPHLPVIVRFVHLVDIFYREGGEGNTSQEKFV